jgi:hypothetical protein
VKRSGSSTPTLNNWSDIWNRHQASRDWIVLHHLQERFVQSACPTKIACRTIQYGLDHRREYKVCAFKQLANPFLVAAAAGGTD